MTTQAQSVAADRDDRPASLLVGRSGGESLAQYVALLVSASSGRRRGSFVPNWSVRHAVAAIAELFRAAERDVRILTGCLNVSVYGDDEVIQAAQAFLNRSPASTIRILYETPSNVSANKFVVQVREGISEERVQALQVPASIRDQYPWHFAVFDDRAFRYEPDKSNFEALVNFDDQVFGHSLVAVFDKIWNRAQP